MSDSLEHAVNTALMRVLETAAFMTVWPWQEADGELAKPDVAASMTFTGPCSGRLTLHVAAKVLPLLTQNMLGELDSAESAEEKSRDALKETLNMICGNLLTEWQGDEPVFKLSPPEIVSAAHIRAMSDKVTASLKFNLENTLAIVDVNQAV